MIRSLILLAILVAWWPARDLVAADPPHRATLLATIQADDARRHVEVLADDSLEGRDSGSPGGHAAAKYLALLFEKYGLVPAGEDGSFYQPFGRDFRNVLGVLQGSDPEGVREFVVIGAHFDHVGYGNRGNSYGPYGAIHNGADDNASGTSALLELIEALHESQWQPRRSILFCLWDAEEDGLLGSKHWLTHPTRPVENVVFSINLDMVGRLRDQGLMIYGERSADDLHDLVVRNNEDGIKLIFDWSIAADSDHHPFLERRIPTVMFHTGLHETYHRPSDDVETLNYEGIEQVTRLIGRVMLEVADESQRRTFREAAFAEDESQRKRWETLAPPGAPRLGLSLQRLPQGEWSVESVMPGTAASEAGIEAGTIISAIDGQPFDDEGVFWDRIHDAPSQVVLSLRRVGGQEIQETPVKLTGEPARIGFSWRRDEGQKSLAIITRVGRWTRADRAGLKPGDRLRRVDGETIESDQWLRERLVTAERDLALSLERDGLCRECVIRLGAPAEDPGDP